MTVKETTVQDVMIKDLLEEDSQDSNETLELLKFMRDHGTPLTKEQVEGMFILNEYGLNDISSFVYSVRPLVTPVNIFYKLIDKLTLADRIKGNAKFSHLMKASANPASTLKPEDIQAKGMSRKEVDRY